MVHVGFFNAQEPEVKGGDTDVGEAPSTGTGSTALHMACYGGHVGVVEVLLANGARVNDTNGLGNTSLFSACSAEENAAELVKLLLNHGADATHTNNHLSTPLHFAAYNHALNSADEAAIISALRTAGANLDAKDDEGNTALHICAKNNRLSFAGHLLG